MLRKKSKTVIVCVNKCDKPNEFALMSEFYSLGFSDVIAISSVHGHGTGDLLDLVFAKTPERDDIEIEKCIKISVLGRPNVGKSSIVNRLCGEQRSIVSDISGTTRDSIDSFLSHEGSNYLIIDTAGIRRRNNSKTDVEKYSMFRALDSLSQSDVCLLVIDAVDGITSQDAKIASIIKKYYKSCILLINKWDKLEPNQQNVLSFEKQVKEGLKFSQYVPAIYISAKTGRNFDKILPTVKKAYESYRKRVSTGSLNAFLRDVVLRTPTPTIKGKQLKIYYMTQSDISPPTFVFFVNKSKLFHFSYQRHIENKLRELSNFSGTPLKFVIRQKGDLTDKESINF